MVKMRPASSPRAATRPCFHYKACAGHFRNAFQQAVKSLKPAVTCIYVNHQQVGLVIDVADNSISGIEVAHGLQSLQLLIRPVGRVLPVRDTRVLQHCL
jgi:hypothetical protein